MRQESAIFRERTISALFVFLIVFVAVFLQFSRSANAEPLFDNNGFTIRDKLRTFAIGYSLREQAFEGIGSVGSKVDITADCWHLGINYGTKESQSTYLAGTFCSGLETSFIVTDNSSSILSVGYIYASPQDRFETYFDFSVYDYPALGSPFLDSSQDFSGLVYSLGFALDVYDGQQFTISAGYEFDLYSNLEDSAGRDVEIDNGSYVKASYLFTNDYALVLRVGVTSVQGAGLTFMKSF